MIEANSGGSNGARSYRYKKRLPDFADETGLEITACHYPPSSPVKISLAALPRDVCVQVQRTMSTEAKPRQLPAAV